MNKLWIGALSLCFASSAFASGWWLSLDAGKSFLEEQGAESEHKSSYLGAKIFYSLEKGKGLLNLGGGVGQHQLNTSYNQGPYYEANFDSTSYFLYLAPGWRLSPSFSLSLENMAILGSKIRVSQSEEQSFFSGLGLNYHSAFSRNFPFRLSATAQRGWNSDKESTLAMISLQFSYEKEQKKVSPKLSSPKLSQEITTNYEEQLFAFDSFSLNSEQKTYLRSLVNMLDNSSWEKIEVEGHTDRIGSASYNQKLGMKRAETIKKYLVSQGLAPDKITIIGVGEGNLLDKNLTDEANIRNRRIVLKIYYDKTNPKNNLLKQYKAME